MNRKGPKKFLWEIAKVIWGQKLPYRCLNLSNLKNPKVNDRTVQLCEPHKLELYLST